MPRKFQESRSQDQVRVDRYHRGKRSKGRADVIANAMLRYRVVGSRLFREIIEQINYEKV
jgi:hypothetical protein